ncbi:hypothetical protein [Jeotgalibacillus marinus]|uniref:Uncharacterized protein n=1 Tax=Jeotgalibacillus marinus TaxID=86667 RepID=A0ABV3Q348_9BACL
MSKPSFLPDTCHEGRDKAYLDIDRFINEGMSGGSVFRFHHLANIEEEAKDQEQEAPPSGS